MPNFNRAKNVQEQVKSLKSEFNTTVKRLDDELSTTTTMVNRIDTQQSQLGTGLSASNQNMNRIENRLRTKFYLFSKHGLADSNYNFPYQVPVVDLKVTRESLPEFQGWNVHHHSSRAVYHYWIEWTYPRQFILRFYHINWKVQQPSGDRTLMV